MRNLRNRLRLLAVLCAGGEVSSFLPSFSMGKAPTRRPVGESCTPCGIAVRWRPSRSLVSTSNLQAVDGAEQAEGHMLPPRLPDADDVEDGTRRVTPGALNGQESLPAVPKDAPDGQVSSNSTAETQEQGLPEVPAVVAATDARNGTGPSQAAKEEQSAVAAKGENEGEEKDSSGSADGGVMPELQGVMDDIFPSEGREGAGEQKAAVEEEEEEAEPRPNLTKKRLKKYFSKDFEDSSWSIGIQWKDKKYEVFTTKVALKADGSVVWLDKGKGTWRLRSKTRDLVFYRDFFLNWNGKRVYAVKLLNNTCDMYLEGQIKGWAPLKALEVMGTFQAVRIGITVDENTPRPPWEDRTAPEFYAPEGKPSRKNKVLLKDVEI